MNDLFQVMGVDDEYGSRTYVVRRDSSAEQTVVCQIADGAPEGSAEQIARALNRLPKAEALLVELAAVLREAGAVVYGLSERADKIEEFFCG